MPNNAWILVASLALNIALILTVFRAYNKLRTNHLTGLLNKEGFDKRRKVSEKGAMLYMDLDRFKEINDKHGHHVGDQMIKFFGEFLKKNIRSTDVVSRFIKGSEIAHLHGDEFLVYLPGASKEDAEIVKEKLISQLQKERFSVEGADKCLTLSVSATIGIAIFDGSYEEAVNEADIKMLEAKKEKGISR